MRWKTTVVLAVLLVGLGTFYYVYEVRQGPERERAAGEKDRLWKGVEAKDVEEVVLRRGADTVHLRKADGAWTLAAPVQARAESRAVEDLLATLTAARMEREIDPGPARPADFGLEPPAAEVTFRAKGEERGLRLGAKSPTGLWVYAQQPGRPAVFLAPDTLLREAQKTAADFRDRTVLAFERKDVKGLEIRTPAGLTLAAEARGADAWALRQPLEAPADREQVGALLEKLHGARIKEFTDLASAAAGAPTGARPPVGGGPGGTGLDRPLVVTLWLGEGKDRAAKTLRLGRTLPDRKVAYAQREGEAGVFLVEEDLVKAVPVTAAALRDRKVLAYDRARLERLELESPKGKVALALEGGAWKITQPAAVRADEGATNNLLWRAQDLRAKDFAAEPGARLAAYGLDRPQVRLLLWEKEAREPRALLLAPARGRDGEAYAAVVGPDGVAGPVALVDARALGELAQSAQDLRDRSLFEAFDTRDVTRLTIQRGGQALTVERRGDAEWALVAPRRGRARAERIEDLLWAFRGLKWRDLVAEQGWDPGRYGLAEPAATVTLAGKDGRVLASLAIGARQGVDTFVRVPGQPALYALDGKSLGELPAAAEDLLL
jgi:hypothetical protein